MEIHTNAFISIAVWALASILIIFILWANHKVWSVILIILALFFSIVIGDYFDRKKLKKIKHFLDMSVFDLVP